MAHRTMVCVHNYRIQPADGPTSMGTCRNCGETKEFQNYIDQMAWGQYTEASCGADALKQIAQLHDFENAIQRDW